MRARAHADTHTHTDWHMHMYTHTCIHIKALVHDLARVVYCRLSLKKVFYDVVLWGDYS